MALRPDYATVAELRAHMSSATAGTDAEFLAAITSASRVIDDHCGRQFGLAGATAERTYVYDGACIDGRAAVAIDDVQTTAGLEIEVDGVTLTADDYTLWPYNAAADAKPWTHVLLTASRGADVTVTATFGWSAVPAVVKSAALIQASRFYVRKDASFGIVGSPELGSEMRLQAVADPDVRVMLQGVRRIWAAA